MSKANLYKAISACQNEKELNQFFEMTFTAKELEMINERWNIFNGLHKGMSQRAIASENNCSVVTVTRGAKAFREKEKQVKKYLKLIFND